MIEIWKGNIYINQVDNPAELRKWIIRNIPPLNPNQARIDVETPQFEAEYLARQHGLSFKTIKEPKETKEQKSSTL